MAQIHNLGFPRIGPRRELKRALERFWQEDISETELMDTAASLRAYNWQQQQGLHFQTVGDFSLYDQVLDTSELLGNLPKRCQADNPLHAYFRAARGRATNSDNSGSDKTGVAAAEMTKWFDTNYHYLVPELTRHTEFSLNPHKLLREIEQAQSLGYNPKPVLIGPVTYLHLAKSKDDSEPLDLLPELLSVYRQLLQTLADAGVTWVQIDEPILVLDLDQHWQQALETSYYSLHNKAIKILLTSYFGRLGNNLRFACQLPTAGLHVDVAGDQSEIKPLLDWAPSHKVVSLGIIDGRNIWKTDLSKTLDWLEPIAQQLGERLWLAPSCSLLHVPVDLSQETQLPPFLKNSLSFAVQKLEELHCLGRALNEGREAVAGILKSNHLAVTERSQSDAIHKTHIRERLQNISDKDYQRQSPFAEREQQQQQALKLPLFATTTIGSFPQTQEIRRWRLQHQKGQLTQEQYEQNIQQEIAHCIQQQEALGLDVLVHGEAERNDMVAYFAEHLEGFAISQFGWVQSYGSRCVKPPIIFGDVERKHTITVNWIKYAQSLTAKPVKGMLTGPVTILNWSFVRDDQPRSQTCQQLALAMRDEVLDLENNGVNIIQVDEAALREGLPLRQQQWQDYLQWAVDAFRLTTAGVKDSTQIHTHMCYSNFNDILDAIARMDADVITIETSRSQGELLEGFDEFNYPNAIGPGVYDIHSPNTPSVDQIVSLLQASLNHVDKKRLWVNPDCGLKTRKWEEVVPALKAMVSASQQLRAS